MLAESLQDLIHWKRVIDKPPAEKPNASGREGICCIDLGGYLLDIESYIHLPDDDQTTVSKLLVDGLECMSSTTEACP